MKKALDSPLLNDNKITGAKNVLLLIRSGNEEATMDEIGTINDHIQREAGNTADIIFGVGTDPELGDAISVLVIATGFSADDQKYAGPTEKIKYTLEDTPSDRQKRESPFGKKTTTNDAEQSSSIKENKNIFFLDDHNDHVKPDFPTNNFAQNFETEEIAVQEKVEELQFFEEERVSNTFETEEKETGVLELFNFDEEETLEAQSFSFDVEEKKQTPKTEENSFFIPEQKEETNFIVEEKKYEEEKPKTSEPKSFIEDRPVEFTFSFTNNAEEIKPSFNTAEKVKTETPKTEMTAIKVETQKEEIKIIEKAPNFDRVTERRNKLQEFNSRYQATENENEFETIPAFRRKNINIGTENASQQQISSFLSENNGQVNLRENKFLNKDVD